MKKKIFLNDVALREGAQVAGGQMNFNDQLIYIEYLLKGKIDCIEIGFPGSSKEQFKQCSRIVDFVGKFKGEKPLLSGLARAVQQDIQAVKDVGCDVCHIYIPSSDKLMMSQFTNEKYGTSPEEKRKWVIKQAVEMIIFARSLGFKKIEYSPEDAARTSKEFLCQIVEGVIEAGADIVNIPDTTGLKIGNEFGNLIKFLRENISNIDRAIISVHCHNDSDHSTHNALQAILNGASQIEGTFYGIGERSGMTKFESILMNVNTRKDIFENIEIGFDKKYCTSIVNFISNSLGMPVPRHWPVVGQQNGICSSGTHQAIEANSVGESAYYSWDPKVFGHKEVETVITQFSGRSGLIDKLERLGFQLSKEQTRKVSEVANKMSASKSGQALSDRELTAIVQDAIIKIPYPILIKQCQTIGGKGTIPTATVVVEARGETVFVAEVGDGPIDATMKSVKRAAGEIFPVLKNVKIMLEDWRPVPVTDGTESLADVYARIKINNHEKSIFTGRAVHPDTIQATAQAFANCLSWYLAAILKS